MIRLFHVLIMSSKPDVGIRFEPVPSGAKLGAGRVCVQLLVLARGRNFSTVWL